MAIDITGEWWRGDSADDVADYLEELAPGGYPVHEVVRAECATCGGTVFAVQLHDGATCARRTCVGCGRMAYMLDSEQYWFDDDPDDVECSCGSGRFEVSAGFSLEDDGEIRWVSIGLRCTRDGVLGCCADRRIRYAPSRHLLDHPPP